MNARTIERIERLSQSELNELNEPNALKKLNKLKESSRQNIGFEKFALRLPVLVAVVFTVILSASDKVRATDHGSRSKSGTESVKESRSPNLTAKKTENSSITNVPTDYITYVPRSFIDIVRFGHTFRCQVPALLPEKLAWVQRDSNEPNCRKAFLAMQSGEWQQARDLYSLAIANDPRNATAKSNRALCDLMMVVFTKQDPFTFFGGALAISTEDSHLIRHSAIEDIEAAMTLHPECGRLVANRAVLYTWAGAKPDLIRSECQRALRLSPDDLICLHTAAVNYNMQGHSKEALAMLDKALAVSPNSSLILTERGIAFWRLGQYKEAEDVLQKALLREPKNPLALYELGLTEIEQREFSKGYDALRKATDLRSDYEDAWRTRAVCALAQKDYPKTIADANRALTLVNGRCIDCLITRGNAFHALKRDREALIDYDNSLKMKPRQARVFRDRAATYAALGFREKALADLNKAISIDPDDSQALSLRAQLGGANGDFEQSTIDNYQARKAAARIDDKAHYNNKTGGVSRSLVSDSTLRLQKESIQIYKRGRIPSSTDLNATIAEYTKVLKLNAGSGDSYYDRGILYFSQQKFDLALKDFRNAARLAAPGQISVLASLLASICLRQQHDDQGALAELSHINEKSLRGTFWKNMVSYACNKIDQAALVGSASNNTERCQARYMVAVEQGLHGDSVSMNTNLQWVRDHADVESEDYFLACTQLSRGQNQKDTKP